MRSLLRITAATVVGLLAGAGFVLALSLYLPVIQARRSQPSLCSWRETLYAPIAQLRRAAGQKLARRGALVTRDGGNRLLLVEAGAWKPWVALSGSETDAAEVVAHLTSEHEWMEAHNPEAQVHRGDIVLDCGAHVGSFSRFAFDHGAAKVIAFEPMQSNIECLRRNFAAEIRDGRFVIVAKAVWNSEAVLPFTVSESSSGTNSAVLHTGEKTIQVQATRIDTAVSELGLDKVTYIKMDIEGAEREALTGAKQTLTRFKPRLMIESYHLPDDSEVLPWTVRSAQPAYAMECGPCGAKDGRLIPYVLYFH